MSNRVIIQPSVNNIQITNVRNTIGVDSGYSLAVTLMGEDTIMYRKLVDFIDGTDYSYVGEASPGAATSSPVWRIKKVTVDSITGSTTGNISESWAGESAEFDKVWDNRASETYL